MVSNREIACGFVRQNRYQVAAFWNQLHVELNTAGPPTKSVFEWKKVWGDQERYVRKKAAQNLLHSRGTGGGLNRQQPLTQAEETIFQLIGAKEAVEGVDGGSVFGIGNQSQNTTDLSDILDECLTEPTTPETQTNLTQCMEDTDFPSSSTPFRKRAKMCTNTILEKELENQSALCNTIAEAAACSKAHNAEMVGNTKRIYRALKKANEEKKRHNLVMEEMMKYKIEKKLEISKRHIELEELKLGITH